MVRAFLNICLGRMHRAAGPLAWLFQVLAVRPGPIGSQILGGVVSAAGATAAVVGLQLGATADDTPARPERPAAANPVERPTPTTDAPSPRREAPSQTPQAPRRPTADVLPVAVPPSAAPKKKARRPPGTRPPSRRPSPAPERGGNRAPQSAPLSRVTDEDGGGLAVDVLVRRGRRGDALSVTSPPVASTARSSIAATADLHMPERDFHGTDGFVYTVVDGQGGESEGRLTVPSGPCRARRGDSRHRLDRRGRDGRRARRWRTTTSTSTATTSAAPVTGARHGSVAARPRRHLDYGPRPTSPGSSS